MAISITSSGTNLFEDLGFTQGDAANLQIRADLMLNLREHMKSKNWTLAQAANRLGETVTTVEQLVEGEIDEFNVDQLIVMLFKAGLGVRVEVIPLVA